MIFIEENKPKISKGSVAQSLAPIYSENLKSSRSTSQDIFHSIVKDRKSWKTHRGGEVVWPPQLEGALIEGINIRVRTRHLEPILMPLFSACL